MNGPKYQRGWIGIAAVMVGSMQNPPKRKRGYDSDDDVPVRPREDSGLGFVTGMLIGESLSAALSDTSAPEFTGGGGVSSGGGADGSW